jgi:hypothetical protein
MAYLAYPVSKAHPPFGDISHHQVPVIVTTGPVSGALTCHHKI